MEPLEKLEEDLDAISLKGLANPPEILWQYTSVYGVHGILPGKKLWATSYQYMNDPSESEYGDRIVVGVAHDLIARTQNEKLKVFVQHYPQWSLTARGQVFLACFSVDGDQLSQWREYGDSGYGYAIGFDGPSLPTGRADQPQPMGGAGRRAAASDL